MTPHVELVRDSVGTVLEGEQLLALAALHAVARTLYGPEVAVRLHETSGDVGVELAGPRVLPLPEGLWLDDCGDWRAEDGQWLRWRLDAGRIVWTVIT